MMQRRVPRRSLFGEPAGDEMPVDGPVEPLANVPTVELGDVSPDGSEGVAVDEPGASNAEMPPNESEGVPVDEPGTLIPQDESAGVAVDEPEVLYAEMPPDDPDDWTDEQWLAWLQAGDAEGVGPVAPVRHRRPTTGGLLGNAMLGLAEAMYGPQRPKIVVQAEAPGDPHGDELELHLDPDYPERSVVVVRRRSGQRPPPPDTGEPS